MSARCVILFRHLSSRYQENTITITTTATTTSTTHIGFKLGRFLFTREVKGRHTGGDSRQEQDEVGQKLGAQDKVTFGGGELEFVARGRVARRRDPIRPLRVVIPIRRTLTTGQVRTEGSHTLTVTISITVLSVITVHGVAVD